MQELLYEQGEFLLRMLISAICGGIIGYERKSRMKEAGVRTHLIVALGSALAMLVSKYGFFDVVNISGISIDASRIAANIITGVSFLGAGVIFVKGHAIKGLTTAAGIWTTSGVGLAIGAGMYIVGVSATLFILIIQVLLHRKLAMLEGPVTEQMVIVMEKSKDAMDLLKQELKECDIKILSLKFQKNDDATVTLELTIKQRAKAQITDIVESVQDNPYILSLDI